MKGYVLSRRARRDLDEIWDYGADRWGGGQANRYARKIARTLEKVVKRPALGRSCDALRSGYFRISSGVHMIFYRVHRDQIRVVRVLHQRMDYSRHL